MKIKSERNEAKKAGTIMNKKVLLPGLVFLTLLFVFSAPASAQQRDTDTLQVVSRTISPGDTTDVFIYLVNSELLGGYTMRMIFDPAILGVEKYPDTSPQAPQSAAEILNRTL